ncbi:MAG: cytochrome c [Thermoleophilia bacterium]|nr:cytochrome c [Thermoleophilia bacterium]
MRRRASLLALALALVAVTLAGCGGAEEAAPTAERVQGTAAAGDTNNEGGVATDNAGATQTQEGSETEAEGSGKSQADAAAGAKVFASAGCGGCHTFKAAGSNGAVGPNLDEADVDMEAAVKQIENGGGGMPPFKGQLSDEEIQDVAAYVTQKRGGGNG